MSLLKVTVQNPNQGMKVASSYDALSLNYLVFLAFAMFISGLFTFAAIGFTILSITPVVIIFHRNSDWKKVATSFALWFATISLIAIITRQGMVTTYLALFVGTNAVISVLLWLFMSGRMTIRNLVLGLSIYAGVVIVAVMTAQNLGLDLIGGLTHRIELFVGSVTAGLKRYNVPEAELQNLLFLQEMATGFVRSCPVALVFMFVLLTGFLNLFLARQFLIPVAHRLPQLRRKVRRKKPVFDEENEMIAEPRPMFEDEIPPGPSSPDGLQLGFNLVWFFIASWAGLLTSYFIGDPLMKTVFINAFLIFSTLYVLQGVIVLSSFYRRLRVNRVIKIVLLFLLLTILPTLITILCIFGLGLFDAWFDLRKLKSDGGQ